MSFRDFQHEEPLPFVFQSLAAQLIQTHSAILEYIQMVYTYINQSSDPFKTNERQPGCKLEIGRVNRPLLMSKTLHLCCPSKVSKAFAVAQVREMLFEDLF